MRFFLVMVITIIIATFLLGCAFNLNISQIDLSSASELTVTFIYGDKNVSHRLSDKELESIKAIFNHKKMYKDNLSCGFSENISIKFDNCLTLCLARDTCPIIYLKEKNMFVRITEEEKIKLYGLLEPYGVFFPCV